MPSSRGRTKGTGLARCDGPSQDITPSPDLRSDPPLFRGEEYPPKCFYPGGPRSRRSGGAIGQNRSLPWKRSRAWLLPRQEEFVPDLFPIDSRRWRRESSGIAKAAELKACAGPERRRRRRSRPAQGAIAGILTSRRPIRAIRDPCRTSQRPHPCSASRCLPSSPFCLPHRLRPRRRSRTRRWSRRCLRPARRHWPPIAYPARHGEGNGRIVTIPPGGETGWNEHAVPLFRPHARRQPTLHARSTYRELKAARLYKVQATDR